MVVLVDLDCQRYGQCVYAAPDVFAFVYEEGLADRVTLIEWLRRVDQPRLLTDPHRRPRRAALRGLEHLSVAFERILP